MTQPLNTYVYRRHLQYVLLPTASYLEDFRVSNVWMDFATLVEATYKRVRQEY